LAGSVALIWVNGNDVGMEVQECGSGKAREVRTEKKEEMEHFI